MAKKCILLVRVSTQKQQFDEQELQLYNMAIADGFKDSDIISIAEKESGIKLSEEERNGLNRMKEVIASENVACVYCWEISRIARRKKIIFSIVELLQSKGIQLIVKEPYIKLLNPDGSINDGAETILTLFAQMAESEMRNKQERWKRTKEKYAREGRYSGGKTQKFGYDIDANGYYVINEEQANIIRLAYDLYINSNIGQFGVQEELKSRGIEIRRGHLKNILQDKGYCGVPVQIYGYQNGEKIPFHLRTYPQIITLETFEKAEQKRLHNNSNVNKSPNWFFGSQLIKCPHCGHNYVAVKAEKRYICWAYYGKDKDYEKCDNSLQLDIIGTDSLLWYDTTRYYTDYLLDMKNGKIEKYQEQINLLQQKVAVCDCELDKSQKKKERVAESYADGVYSREQYKSKLQDIDNANADTEAKKSEYLTEITRLEELINFANEATLSDRLLNIFDDLNGIEDFKKMYDLVHQFITSISVELATIQDKEVKKLILTHIDGTETIYFMEKRKRIKKINFWEEKRGLNGSLIEDITDRIKIINRQVGRKERGFK